MNIVSLKIKNFLSIRDVEIKPGQINQITGKNNQGKTSIIKAIEFAVNGSTDGNLVRFGEDDAEVILELDDKTNIRRRITSEGKQSVTVKKEGFKADTPQTMLEAMFATSSFNPLDLLDPKKRNDAILNSIDLKVDAKTLSEQLGVPENELPPIDYDQHGLKVLEQCHKYFYQRRAEANKDFAEKKKRYDTYASDLPEQKELPSASRGDVEQDLEDIMAKINTATEDILKVVTIEDEVRRAISRMNEAEQSVKDLDAKVRFHRHEMEKAEAARGEAEKTVQKARDAIPTDVPDKKPIEAHRAQLRVDYEAKKATLKDFDHLESVAKQKQRVYELEIEWKKAEEFGINLTHRVEKIAGPMKKALMESAAMPVPGLEYKSGVFLVDGIPVDNLSSSKAIKLAVGVARKLCKRSKLICLDGAEALDEATYGELIEAIKDDGFVYFITSVGDRKVPGAKSFEMKDGAIIQ